VARRLVKRRLQVIPEAARLAALRAGQSPRDAVPADAPMLGREPK